jgi:[ribosomal protein S5]-alanine N-acetyltransferase
MILQSERLYVRRYTLEDEDVFFQLNSDPEVMRFIRPPKSRAGSRAFLIENIDFYDKNPGLGRWALEERGSGRMVGTFSLLPLEHTDDVHIGYALMKDNWGKGYASEIVKAGIDYAFKELKLDSIVAVTYPEHFVSQKVLLRNGFDRDGIYQEEGKENFLFRINKVKGKSEKLKVGLHF